MTDGAYTGPFQSDDVFPYLKTPLPGSPNEAKTRIANLIDQNLLGLVEPFEPTGASGFCEVSQFIRLFERALELSFIHNVTNPLNVTITRDGPDGEALWFFDFLDLFSDPPASPGTLVKVLDETNYIGSEPLEIFADGFESGDTSVWATVEGNPTKIAGPFR